MTAAQITTRLTIVLLPEVERLLLTQTKTIADLEQRLSAANDRATAAEARLEHLRQVLNPPPVNAAPEPVVVVEPVRPVYPRDEIVAAFHAKRNVGPVSITELSISLGVNKPNAQWYYTDWCRRHDTKRINYYSNGQRAN